MEKLESTYFSKLDLKAKERYKEKIKLIENVDPYKLQKKLLQKILIVFQKSHIQILSHIQDLMMVSSLDHLVWRVVMVNLVKAKALIRKIHE